MGPLPFIMFCATTCHSRDILCESSVWLFSSRIPKSSRKGTHGHGRGRPVHTRSGGGKSTAASSAGVSTSGPVLPVQPSSFSGSSLSSEPVVSSARATGNSCCELLITSLFRRSGEHCLGRLFAIMVIILFVYFRLSHFLTPSCVCIFLLWVVPWQPGWVYLLISWFFPRESSVQLNPIGGSSFFLLVGFYPLGVIPCVIIGLVMDTVPTHLA